MKNWKVVYKTDDGEMRSLVVQAASEAAAIRAAGKKISRAFTNSGGRIQSANEVKL